jgi:hypothetical protein
MALINRSESLYWELMPLQGTEHWRSYIKTACEIGLLVMLFIQVVHKAGSSSQVYEEGSAAHQGEAELEAGEMVLELSHKKEMVTHPLRPMVKLTRGKLMKKYSGSTKWRLMRMNVSWKRTPQMMRMTRSSKGVGQLQFLRAICQSW